MAEPALSHAEAEELMALAALGALERGEGAPLEEHLARCVACRATARAFERAVAVLPSTLEPQTPSPDLRRRLLTAVYSTREPRPRRSFSLRALWRLLPQSRGFTVGTALAAAAAVVLGVWGATRGSNGAAPVRAFPVVAASIGGMAQGQLTVFPDQHRAVLTVTGLPSPGRAAAGSRVYEVWLVPRSGAPVGATFLSAAPQTSAWSAAIDGDVLGYKAVAATVEPPGGSRAPTTPPVFSVALSG